MTKRSMFDVPASMLTPDEYQTHTRDASRDVVFSAHQVAYLETVFPELVHVDSHSDAQIRHRLGQRSVIAHIREKATR